MPPQGLPACVSISRSLCQHRVKEAVLFFWEPSGDLFHPTQASVKWGWLSGTPEDQRGNKDSEMRGRGGGRRQGVSFLFVVLRQGLILYPRLP